MPLNSSSYVQFGDIVLEKKVTIAALASATQAEVASCVFIYYIAMLSTLAALLATICGNWVTGNNLVPCMSDVNC